MKSSKKIRVSCRQGSYNSKYYANVWCGLEQLGHGEADTRVEAIALAKADWKRNAVQSH